MIRMTLLLIASTFLMIGCAAVEQGKIDFETCWQDVECRDQATAKAESISSKAAAVAVVSPIPGTSAVVKPIAAGIALIVSLITGGKAIRER